ncbi:hypothetical protein EX30DRAFT_325361 [Ascodesmis nigricans]|uniref:C2 domain-containing protein n=1 Tax=Ascodesmis nigricans TaxID=341454 RepID=A0A4S2N656_9PEZI|nr:hypothetical protein EX30DRAFT_325361 [Ascodesmis nigricans]
MSSSTSPTTYTLRITFARAHSLPVADVFTLSSDPFVLATLRFPTTSSPKLRHRTPTLRRTTDPVWNNVWTVSHVPATGVRLKLKVKDEDTKNRDDGLGVAYIESGPLENGWKRSFRQGLSLSKGGDAAVMMLRLVTVGWRKGRWKCLGGEVDVEMEVVEYDGLDEELGKANRPFTLGPNWWSQHYSPLIGIITNTKSPVLQKDGVQRYLFTATKLQLTGPVPSNLSVRYVAFRPLIKTFYTKSGIRGRVLNRALKHQYRTIYSYDRHTEYGVVDVGEHRDHQENLARRFLEITNWGQGGRVYTYVITLDGEWRFTETGKEFGIQMLSKHTMHSEVSVYVAFAGEFYGRGRNSDDDKNNDPRQHQHHLCNISHKHQHSEDPADYELVIDNDSGTYRPNKALLPTLEAFLARNLKGLKVSAKHCFDDDHASEKKGHAKAKEARGRARFKQPSSSRSPSSSAGSISSGDEEELVSGRMGVGRRVRRRMWRELEGSGDESGRDEDKKKEKGEKGENEEDDSGEDQEKPEKKREKMKQKIKRTKEVAKEKKDEKKAARKDERKDAQEAEEYQEEEEKSRREKIEQQEGESSHGR